MGKQIVSYEDKLREFADEYADLEKSMSQFITTRGGVLAFGEDELPGNQLVCVVLDFVRENAYYIDEFDPEVMVPPTCFAFGRSKEDMAPDEMSDHPWFEPQNEQCLGCEYAEFGSAPRGRGKACGERRRLALIPAGYVEKEGRGWGYSLFDKKEDFQKSEIAFLKLPPTSVKNWQNFVRHVAKQHSMPPFGVITHISIEADPKTQYKICFDMLELLDRDLYETILARHEEAEEVIAMPYPPPDEELMEEAGVRGRSSVKSRRRSKSSRRRHRSDDD